MININGLDEFTDAYIECALWSSADNANEQGGAPLDDNYGPEDIAPETLAIMVEDCRAFQESFEEFIADDLSRAGHDFWLTRNGHGAGFCDGDWDKPHVESRIGMIPRYPTVGDYLTAMSKPYGEFYLYIGDDGRIHGM